MSDSKNWLHAIEMNWLYSDCPANYSKHECVDIIIYKKYIIMAQPHSKTQISYETSRARKYELYEPISIFQREVSPGDASF